MKRTVTTLTVFEADLRRLEASLGLTAALSAHVTEDIEREDLEDFASLHLSQPVSAPDRGRGERIEVVVSTCWNEPPFRRTSDPLDALRAAVASLPGVEHVGEAAVDPQLRTIWSFAVTLRLSQ